MSFTAQLSTNQPTLSITITDYALLELDYIQSLTDEKLQSNISIYTLMLDSADKKMDIYSIACNLSMLYNEVAKRAINSQWESFNN
jgi:hypothetical protein